MKNAFSLVELSIVLVILGLLTGGILTGQSLIRAAELRSVTTEFQTYQTAVTTFRDKYFALPGDMRNATDFWGSIGGGGIGAACWGVDATGRETCNGDGGGYLYQGDASSTGGGVNVRGERFRFWQHLANAGLIAGQYSGRTDSTSDSFALTSGKNAPASKLSNGLWSADSRPALSDNAHDFSSLNGLSFTLRSFGNQNVSPLYVEETWNIDTKIDDGQPGTGILKTRKLSSTLSPNCSTTDDEATALYALTNTDDNCYFKIFLGY